jgi:tetratricopeptide (TPR) repeat protein
MRTSQQNSDRPPPQRPPQGRAVGRRLRILLYLVFGLAGVAAVNSVYMASITALEWYSRRWGEGVSYQDHFYLSMFAVHLALGLVLIVPFLVFGVAHVLAARRRRNRRAVRIGYALLAVCLLLLASGVLLVRLEGLIELKNPNVRAIVYWLHVLSPLAAVWLYWLHRLAGPRIKWGVAKVFACGAAVVVLTMVIWQMQDPRRWTAKGPQEGIEYFQPSRVKTADGKLIPARSLMMDEYCRKCHPDAYEGWFHSVHHFSSFNNAPYRASVRETRRAVRERPGDAKAVRLCAGCHDPVPFLSGAFDNQVFDDTGDATAHAGITCTVCHAITNINSTVGNGDYTIEEPLHYPFAYRDHPWLQYINHQLVKAKPAFHKRTFLKPFHMTAEFCSVCHKVHLPGELTDYKEFLRGQNHYDSYLLSGVSGHGARSFYYPELAETNCNGCHMPLQTSNDFGAKVFDDSGRLKIHNHLFPSANTAIAHLRGEERIVAAHQQFLQGVTRVDIFGVKADGSINGALSAPLRPAVPTLRPGGKYLLETVIRTLKMGHFFTEGTTDSNEIWLDVTAVSGDREIGRSGAMDPRGEVDRWAHFVNVFMLDRDGRRINRRNAQDIFVPLYNHQIPPGAAQVVHYELELPEDLREPVTVEVKLQYRKFDYEYMKYVAESGLPGDPPLRGDAPAEPYVNRLPIATLAVDRVVFPVAGGSAAIDNPPREIPDWERWNDYGIGLLLEGRNTGAKGELRQAAEAFETVEQLGPYHGPLNLARVYFTEGRLDEAVAAANRAAAFDDAPAWTIGWLSGLVNKQQGYLDKAVTNFRSVLEDRTPEMVRRRFDFSLDYEVINELGQALFERAKQFRGERRRDQRDQLLRQAVGQFEKTLQIDAENVTAHYNLALLYNLLGEKERATHHQRLHARYKPDDNARDRAIALARQRYPAANHAAEALVIYSLHRHRKEPNR